jgi:hypothetical protein
VSPAHTGDENPTHGLVNNPDKPFEWTSHLSAPWIDRAPPPDNENYRESMTIWAVRISAQVRNHDEIVLFHYPGAPRSTEDGKPWILTTLDSVLLRDLLNTATARGYLPKPEGRAAEDAINIGSRPTFVDQVAHAYQQGLRDAMNHNRSDIHPNQGEAPQ